MKDKLLAAAKIGLVAFLGALLDGAVQPQIIKDLLALLGL